MSTKELRQLDAARNLGLGPATEKGTSRKAGEIQIDQAQGASDWARGAKLFPTAASPPSLCPPPPQLAQKYDHQREQELREWIEGVTGRRIGNNFMDGLKDGIILCE